MCRYCEYPFYRPNPLMKDGSQFDYIGYGIDNDGFLCLIAISDFGYEGLDEWWRVGPSTGITTCMFCGRTFEDEENFSEERDTEIASKKREGIYVADFDNGEHIERPFLYSREPHYAPIEIDAFADDAESYASIAEATVVNEYALAQDDHEYGVRWLSSYEYGRLSEIKNEPVFYFSDNIFWA